MKENRLRSFLWLQCCLLLLFVGSLPQLDMVSMLTGVNMDVLSMLYALVFGVIGGVYLFRFFQWEKAGGNKVSMSFFVSAAVGIVLAPLASINVLPDWCGYLALVALGVALWMAKDSLKMSWSKVSSRGAYLILLALVLRFYQGVDEHFLTNVAALVGFVLYWIGLGVLKGSLDEKGVTGCSKLRIAVILAVIGALVDFIPLLGWLAVVLMILAFIIEFLGYGALASSDVLSERGCKGVKLLRLSMILSVIAWCCYIIPFFGGRIVALVSAVVVFLVFFGWSSIIEGLEEEQKTA